MLQPIQSASLTQSFSEPAVEVDGGASWPLVQPESKVAVELASIDLVDASKPLPNPSPISAPLKQLDEPKLAPKNQLNPIVAPFENPQPEPLFYTLPPMKVSAGSTFQTPLAEIQQEQTNPVEAQKADVVTDAPAKFPIPSEFEFWWAIRPVPRKIAAKRSKLLAKS